MEPTTSDKNNLSIPVAIIIAGALIALGMFFSNKAPATNTTTTNQTTNEAAIRAIGPDDHIYGNPQAKVVILEYGDTECPPCKFFHEVMHGVMDSYGKNGEVAWVFRHLPIAGLHVKAQKEAEATECAFEQGGNDAFWNYINKIYEITPSNDGLDPAELPKIAEAQGLDVVKFNACLSEGKYKAKVDADYKDALIATNFKPATPHVRIFDKDGLSTDEKAFLTATFGPGNLEFKSDGSIAIAGAMRLEAMQIIINKLLGK